MASSMTKTDGGGEAAQCHQVETLIGHFQDNEGNKNKVIGMTRARPQAKFPNRAGTARE